MWVNQLHVEEEELPLKDWKHIEDALSRLDGDEVQEVEFGRDLGGSSNRSLLISTDGEGLYSVSAFNGEQCQSLMNPDGDEDKIVEMNIGNQTTDIPETRAVSREIMLKAAKEFAMTGTLARELTWG